MTTPTRLSIVARTSVGRVRKRNEDAFLVADLVGGIADLDNGLARVAVGENGTLLAVSDGMGGHKGGDVASALTLDTLYRALIERTSSPSLDARLIRATETANAAVYEAGRRPSLAKMGATVTAVLVTNDIAYVAEVGDSRAYVVRDGKIHRLTEDQNFAAVAVQTGALDPNAVADSPLRNMLLQAIGQTLDLSVELTALKLRRRDCLVLVSDGLTSKVSDDEVAAQILSAPSLDAACATLIDLANARGGEDNITVVLAGVSDGPPATAEDETFSGTFEVLQAYQPKPLPK